MTVPAKWTFMVYLGGDNDLSHVGERVLDEMRQVGSTPEVNIVAQFDRSGGDHETRRYHIQREGVGERPESLGETDTGDPKVLLDFVGWAVREYPAERYALIYWNHGPGWSPSEIDKIARRVGSRGYGWLESVRHSSSPLGRVLLRPTIETIYGFETGQERAIAYDDAGGFILDTIGLGEVLAEAVESIGGPIDLFGSDGAFLLSLEMAYQVWPYVRYIIASEENELNNGWPYNDVLAKLVAEPELETPDLGAHIVKAYVDSYAITHHTVTQAVVDLSKLDSVVGPIDELAGALCEGLSTGNMDTVRALWRADRVSASFGYRTHTDISGFCAALEAGSADSTVRGAARAVQMVMQPAADAPIVAASRSGAEVEGCGGIAIYKPPPTVGVSRLYSELAYAEDHRWLDMLEAYHGF